MPDSFDWAGWVHHVLGGLHLTVKVLLHEAQIVGTPGAGFGACGEGYLRFSTFGSLTDTEEAARRLLALLG